MSSVDGSQSNQPTRTRLLGLLRVTPRTVEELATATGVTANAVRAQLASLGRDGLVSRAGVRHGESAGKPPVLYTVTEQAQTQFSLAYVPALTAVAETLAGRLSSDALRQFYAAACARLARNVERPPNGDAPTLAKAVIESLGGVATIRRGGDRAILQGAGCPLATTVRACPESCELVRSLLANATGVPVATRCDHGQVPTCRFEVG